MDTTKNNNQVKNLRKSNSKRGKKSINNIKSSNSNNFFKDLSSSKLDKIDNITLNEVTKNKILKADQN